jgi:hypothetical protein
LSASVETVAPRAAATGAARQLAMPSAPATMATTTIVRTIACGLSIRTGR